MGVVRTWGDIPDLEAEEEPPHRIYLPSQEAGVDTKDYLNRYIGREFPSPQDGGTAIYSIPQSFQSIGEKQASLAEEEVFRRLSSIRLPNLWMTFFHSASYGGHSFRNQRVGKLMIREHDFVAFIRHDNKRFVLLAEVKSTNDSKTTRRNLEKTSDARVIKNNKRSAQHQLRDHLEVLGNILRGCPLQKGVQTYIVWPFLGSETRDPSQRLTQRWKEDKNMHVFEESVASQTAFDEWFANNVLRGVDVEDDDFVTLFNRFIILSCGVFVEEINSGLMALLNREQLDLLNGDFCRKAKPLVVHGPAGSGKTLMVLRKLEQLYRTGRLDENNRAIYICYWPGIRYDFELKMDSLGIRSYVDTTRFFISLPDFFSRNANKYKHIFMDEAEAICLALDSRIISQTMSMIYACYHAANCTEINCVHTLLRPQDDIAEKLHNHEDLCQWGELWFMVDTNQASLFLPKHSPQILKTPSVLLSKVMRSTGYIFDVFKQFYTLPMPLLPKAILNNVNIPEITLGHHVFGPPIYWVDSKSDIDETVAKLIMDLCATKGFKASDLCVIPFLVNEKLVPERINKHIDEAFVENTYRPCAIKDVEHYLKYREINSFLMAWALRVKGLEFKVVIMAIDDDDFDFTDPEDRKKAYIMMSRCTSMLIVVSTEKIKTDIDLMGSFEKYSFSIGL